MGGEARKTRRVMKAALTNPLIAERILNQADFEEKKELRLVNKFWRDSTLTEWRQSVTLQLYFDPDAYFFSRPERDVLTVKSFEAIMEGRAGVNGELFRIHDMPFRRLILYGQRFISDNPERLEEEIFKQLVHFLAKFGSSLEYLQLEWLRISHPFFESLMKRIMSLCPKLKELVINDCFTWYTYCEDDDDDLIDYDSLLEAFFPSLQLFPEREASKLTQLTITISEEVNDSAELPQFWGNVISQRPIVKQVLKYRPKKGVFSFGLGNLIIGASRLPLTELSNANYLELEELDLHFDLREASSTGYEEFTALGTYFEVAQPPLKKLRMVLHFNGDEVRGMEYANEMSSFHQFCIGQGHRLTELKINFVNPCFCKKDDFQWISFLTGHYFPNLTHFTIVCFERAHDSFDEDRSCIPGKINFDFEVLKGMPKLQVFHCFEKRYDQHAVPQRKLTPTMLKLEENGVMPWRDGQEVNKAYEKPIELKELKEFRFFSSTDLFDEGSLKIVLGWMKNLKKLTLHLNKDTLPIVFETLPHLVSLTLLGIGFCKTTEAELEFRTIWMDEVSRARQEKEWRNKQKRSKAKEELGEVEVMRREKEKEKRRVGLERKRAQMERQEREWIGNQGKEEGEWNYVSYRKRQPLSRLPPRQSLQNQSALDNAFVISEILKWKNKTNVFLTIYSNYDWCDWIDHLQSEKTSHPHLQIQYKAGED